MNNIIEINTEEDYNKVIEDWEELRVIDEDKLTEEQIEYRKSLLQMMDRYDKEVIQPQFDAFKSEENKLNI